MADIIQAQIIDEEIVTPSADPVAHNIPGGGAVESVNGKTGAVVLTAGDVGAVAEETFNTAMQGKQDKLTAGTGAEIKDGVLSATTLGITGAAVGQIARITAVDSGGKPTAWEPVDMASGESSEVKEWEEFMRFTVDNAETIVFDFSSNGTETLESKKVKEFYLYSPSRSQTGAGGGGASATISVNNCVTVTNLHEFCRSSSGSLKLSLAAAADLLKFRYFGRDTEVGFGSSSLIYRDTSNGEISANNKNYAAYIIGEKNGIPFPSAPVDYIETVTITLSAPCNSGVEFIVYVR